MGHRTRKLSIVAEVPLPDPRLGEVHHRVANSLAILASFVRLQAASLAREGIDLSPTEAKFLLEEIGARIETVARFNRLLSVDPERPRVALDRFLAAACQVLGDSIARDSGAELFCHAPPCEIDREQAELVGAIVAELVTNAVKYAHPAGAPGRIDVRCRATCEGLLDISVADDGVGLPEGFDPAASRGLGMRVIRSLARQLDAEVDFDSHSLGLTVRLTVPTAATASLSLAAVGAPG